MFLLVTSHNLLICLQNYFIIRYIRHLITQTKHIVPMFEKFDFISLERKLLKLTISKVNIR